MRGWAGPGLRRCSHIVPVMRTECQAYNDIRTSLSPSNTSFCPPTFPSSQGRSGNKTPGASCLVTAHFLMGPVFSGQVSPASRHIIIVKCISFIQYPRLASAAQTKALSTASHLNVAFGIQCLNVTRKSITALVYFSISNSPLFIF